MDVPTPAEVETTLLALVEGKISREEASDWARRWVVAWSESMPEKKTWQTLCALYGADAVALDRPYLYEEDDFRSWLAEFRER